MFAGQNATRVDNRFPTMARAVDRNATLAAAGATPNRARTSRVPD